MCAPSGYETVPPSQVDVVVVVLKSNHGALLPAQLNARWLILLLERRRKEGSALVLVQ